MPARWLSLRVNSVSPLAAQLTQRVKFGVGHDVAPLYWRHAPKLLVNGRLGPSCRLLIVARFAQVQQDLGAARYHDPLGCVSLILPLGRQVVSASTAQALVVGHVGDQVDEI